MSAAVSATVKREPRQMTARFQPQQPPNQKDPMAKKQKSETEDLATQVADKIAEQHRKLTLDNWEKIKEVMDADDDHEIKVSFATTLTNRPAEPGTVASKDSRIITVASFSLGKHSQKTESPFPDPHQMTLDEQPPEG